jgi:shikimate dehydrogenase
MKHPTAFARKAKRAGADILEIRGDLTPRVRQFASPLPILLALRGASEELIRTLRPKYLDLELGEKVEKTPVRIKSIRSYHDYRRTPSLRELRVIVGKLRQERPWMIKIATVVRTYEDLRTLETLRVRLERARVRAVVLGMGEKAHLIRALSPLHSPLTYAYLDGSAPSAPGQLSLSFTRSEKHLRSPRIFGILGGSQVTQSLSPAIHRALFQRAHVDALYARFPTENLSDAWTNLGALGVRGFSVTAPFKRAILRYAKRVDPLAKKLRSANTMMRTKQGQWMAFNTDVHGFGCGYPFLKSCTRVAILGAGGVVPAVIEALSRICPSAEVTVYARNVRKATKVLTKGTEVRLLSELRRRPADAIICAIPKDIRVALPPAKKGMQAIDLRYGGETKFLSSAKRAGYRTHDGLSMLLHQALAQFQLFTGRRVRSDAALRIKRILRHQIT